MDRKIEYFTPILLHRELRNCANTPRRLYPQKRDWTCAVACARSIASLPVSEDTMVSALHLKVGPHYSDEMVSWFPREFQVVAGRDNTGYDISDLLYLLQQGYYVSLMYSFHWRVLIGHIMMGDIEHSVCLLYDPYYNRVEQVITDELCALLAAEMDFVAVKEK